MANNRPRRSSCVYAAITHSPEYYESKKMKLKKRRYVSRKKIIPSLLAEPQHAHSNTEISSSKISEISQSSLIKFSEKFGHSYKSIMKINNRSNNVLLKLRQRRLNNNNIQNIKFNNDLELSLSEQMVSRLQLQKVLKGHTENMNCLLFDVSGRYLFTGGSEKFIKIWDTIYGKLLFTLRGHDDQITALAINQENTLLASGSADHTVRIWNIKSGSCVCCLYGLVASVTRLQFHPSNGESSVRYIIATSQDGHILSWQYRDRKDAWIFDAPKYPYELVDNGCKIFSCASYSSSGCYLAATTSPGNTLIIFALYRTLISKIFSFKPIDTQHIIHDVQFSNNDARFVSVSCKSIISLWTPNKEHTYWRVHKLKKANQVTCGISHYGPGYSIRWSHDDKYIAVVGNLGRIGIWNSSNRELCRILNYDSETEFDTIDFHPKNHNILISLDFLSRITIWNVESGQRLCSFNEEERRDSPEFMTCIFSPQGSMFASIDMGGNLYIYGLGENILFNSVPREMFFDTDFIGVSSLDNGTFVLDVEQSIAPSLMPKPKLVNVCLEAYPEKLQCLVPDRNQSIIDRSSDADIQSSYMLVKKLIESHNKVDPRKYFNPMDVQVVDKFRRDKEDSMDGEVVIIDKTDTDCDVDIMLD